MSCSPQNSMQLMGISCGHPAKHAEQKLQTTHRQPSFSSPSCCKGKTATTVVGPVDVGMFPASRPFPNTGLCAQALAHISVQRQSGGRRLACLAVWLVVLGPPFVTAPLVIHNHKAIFGWAANLFLAAATSQTTTAEKSGPARLGDPVLGRGDVEGHSAARELRAPSPCLPVAHCPHPTSHRRAWPALPSLVWLPSLV